MIFFPYDYCILLANVSHIFDFDSWEGYKGYQRYPFMFYVSQQDSKRILDWNDMFQFSKIFDEKRLLPRDLNLTKRQVGLLTKYSYFDEADRASKGWRRFSLYEAVAIRIIREAQMYGLDKDDIQKLSATLLDDPSRKIETTSRVYPLDLKEMAEDLKKGSGKSAILASILGLQMSLIWSHFDPCVSPIFCSEEEFQGDFRTLFTSFLKIDLSHIVEETLQRLAEKEGDQFFSLLKLVARYSENDPILHEGIKGSLKELGNVDVKTLVTFFYTDHSIPIIFDPKGEKSEVRHAELEILKHFTSKKCKKITLKKVSYDQISTPLRE